MICNISVRGSDESTIHMDVPVTLLKPKHRKDAYVCRLLSLVSFLKFQRLFLSF